MAEYLDATPQLADARDERGVSMLMTALYHHNESAVKAIRLKKLEFDIFEAASLGDLKTLRSIYLDRPEAINDFASDAFTPLHLAAFFNRTEIARFLLAHGADVEAVAKNPTFVRPLHSAAATRDARMVRIILAAGADADAKQMGGHTALHSAVMHKNAAMTVALLAHGAAPDVKNNDDHSAFDIAKRENAAECLELLRRFSPIGNAIE